ncbi:MAG: SIS domain-containing protein [Chitinivibrionales bacterium]|nr:SIS domain-containing protein [Chitinivibrionales bacterium]MBD3358340.1 SIS domain-containing protein [Chitinivibrionales bacterium]
MKKTTEKHLDGLLERYSVLRACRDEVVEAHEVLVECCKSGGKILVCGNGGSYADAEHIVGELMKDYLIKRPIPAVDRERIGKTAASESESEYLCDKLQRAVPALPLSAHGALPSAVANDTGADIVYAQQVYGLGRPGDVLWGISTSGNSKNVLYAMKVARAIGVKVLGMTGASGGAVAGCCDVTIRVPESATYKIQELHLPVYHTLCSMLEQELFGE